MDFGPGIDPVAIFVLEAIDVIPMEMTDQHMIDVLRLVTCRRQVGDRLASCWRTIVGKASVNQVFVAVMDDEKRGEGNVEVAGRQVLRGKQ